MKYFDNRPTFGIPVKILKQNSDTSADNIHELFSESINSGKCPKLQKLAKITSAFINPLSANPTKWSITLKHICLIVFHHFVGLALEGLKTSTKLLQKLWPCTYFTSHLINI